VPKFLSSLDQATILRAALIIAVGLWIYSPVYHGAWLWDDDTDIYNNPITLNPAGWWMNWFEPGRLQAYYPIKADTQWVQWRLWGNHTLGYHLTNIVFHLCSALLIWRLLGKIGLRLAWLGGLLFVVHPVTIESVAWIAELKNTISLPPFLLALCCWVEFDKNHRPYDYIFTFGWFVVAVLCKISTALFPALILLYAWWKHGGLKWSDLKATAPFWIMSLGVGLITLSLHQSHALNDQRDTLNGLLPRLSCVGMTCLFFVFKAMWPVGMLPIYPAWKFNPLSVWETMPDVILVGLLVWFWTRRKGWGRHALLGFGFFLINLVPVIITIQLIYSASMIWSLDHLGYISLIGLIGLAVAGLDQIQKRLSTGLNTICGWIVAVIILVMAMGSHLYASAFVNPETLWSYTLERNPEAWPAFSNLVIILQRQGDNEDAFKALSAAIKINPENAEAQNGLGNIYSLRNQMPEAIFHYETALKYNPNYTPAYNGLGNALLLTGDLTNARSNCEKALKIDPNYVSAHCTLGLIFAQMGQISSAIEQFQIARQLDPRNAKIQADLKALIRVGE